MDDERDDTQKTTLQCHDITLIRLSASCDCLACTFILVTDHLDDF